MFHVNIFFSFPNSNGRKRLKRYGDVLDVDDRNAKRLKQSPLRQSITFNHLDDDDDDDESEQGVFDAKSKLGSESFYQDSELVFDAVTHDDDADIDEIEQDYEDEEYDDDDDDDDDDYEYDPNNQSDDDDDDDEDDFNDDEYVQYFEENLRQPNS